MIATVIVAAVVGALAGWAIRPLAQLAIRGGARLSRRTAAVASLVTGGCFVLVTATTPDELILPLLLFTAGGVALSVVDIAEKRLPNAMVLITGALVAVGLVASAILYGDASRLLFALAGAAGGFVIYFALAVISPAGMGMGDVKLAAVVGLLAGFLGWTTWLTALVAGFVLGALVSLVALALRRANRRTLIPFGPSMLLGALLVVAFL